MIHYRETFETMTPESAEHGDVADSGFIDENTSDTFADMVEKLRFTEPSSDPLPVEPNMHVWYTHYKYNDGTREYYEQGIEESRSYHPLSERDARYMAKAWKMANGK